MKKWFADNRKLILGAAALLIVIAAVGGLYLASRPHATAETRRITVTVVDAQGQSTPLSITTDAPYLRGALDQQKLISGDESAYGLFVKTVNGITADESQQQWWCFTKNGESLTTGVDVTPIADGDAFTVTLTTGY